MSAQSNTNSKKGGSPIIIYDQDGEMRSKLDLLLNKYRDRLGVGQKSRTHLMRILVRNGEEILDMAIKKGA